MQAFTGSVPPTTKGKNWFIEGELYELGSGRDIDLTKAFKCYKKASKYDDVDGLVHLAFFRAHGIGCKVDSYESERLLKRAVELGSEGAMFQLGYSLLLKKQTLGQKEVQDEALHLFTMAEERGCKDASVLKAVITIIGCSSVPKDVQKGTKILEEVSSTGNVSAFQSLASLYFCGIEIQKNVQKALEYYCRAIDLGSISASVELGKLLLDHESIHVEAAMIRLWEEEAERRNHPGAQYLMGVLYWMGIGLERNEEEAVRFLRMAADAGVGEAISHLKVLSVLLGADIIGDGDLLRWARAGTNAFNERAMSQLGLLYEYGEGVEKDLQKAIDCYTSSLSLEFNVATMYRLWTLLSKGGPVQDLRTASGIIRQYLSDHRNRERFETLKAK
jgi:TPR repeat protein